MSETGSRLPDLARSLAFQRRAGSDGGRRVVDLLARRLEGLGFEVAVESFSYDRRPAERALRQLLAGAAVVVVTASWLAAQAPSWSVALLAVAAIGGRVLVMRSSWLGALYRRPGPIRTTNVAGRRPAASPRLRIVLVAHHDSKSQSLAMPVRLAATVGAAAGTAAVAAAAGTGLVLVPGTVPGWLPAAAGVVAGLSLAALAAVTSGDASPGGVDNAGSLAIVLELAAGAEALPPDVELVVLFTGAEEDRMVGAVRWLDRHHGELERIDTVALNLDGAGAPGRTVLITRDGLGRPLAPRLAREACEAAAALGERVRRIVMAPGLGIDAVPFARRGLECLTLSSGSLGRATFAVHSAGDVADNLDGSTMERVLELARAVLGRVAAA